MNNNLIKSKILYIISCLLFINSLSAKVNPEPGENLWRLAARIGDCVDVADSKLDVLESQNDLICSKIEKVDVDLATHNDIVCSKLATLDSVVDSVSTGIDNICSKIEDLDEDLSVHDASICSKLEQIDTKQDLLLSAIDELAFVGACETLIFQSDIPFTIDSSGVYCLAESVSFAIGTAITIASDNVLFDLQDKKIDGSTGGDIGIAINSGLSNITIQNGVLCNMNNKGIDADATKNIEFISMSISDSLIDSVVDMVARFAPITCLQIKDIKVLNVGIFKEFPIISVVDSIVDSVIDTPDCILSPITGININCATKVILDNCKVLYGLGDGFALSMVDNGTIESCQAIKNGGNGFVLDNTDTTCFKWCKANMNCFHGVCDSACNGDNFYLGCIAKQNGIHGFNIAGGGKVLRECIASQNTRDGFNLSTSLLKDADLDPTFGTGGIVIGYVVGVNDTFNAVALQKDGKIVIAGFVTDPIDFVVIRLTTEGNFDPTFGTGGIVTTDFPGVGDDIGNAVAVQKDGKIVVAGQASNDFAVARYNTDGSLDVSFGTGGKVTTNFGGTDIGNAVAIQKDGKIVVAGIGGASEDFAVARYNTDGSLDVTFNPTGSLPGTVITNLGGEDESRTSYALPAILKPSSPFSSAMQSRTATPRLNTTYRATPSSLDSATPTTTILPSFCITTALAKSVPPKSVVTVPGKIPVGLKVISKLPSVLYRATAKVKVFALPATTILPSFCSATAFPLSSPPKSVVTVPGKIPVGLKVTSKLPSVLYRATAKSLSDSPATTILPSFCSATAFPLSIPPKLVITVPGKLPVELKVISKLPSVLYRATAKSPSASPAMTILPSF